MKLGGWNRFTLCTVLNTFGATCVQTLTRIGSVSAPLHHIGLIHYIKTKKIQMDAGSSSDVSPKF